VRLLDRERAWVDMRSLRVFSDVLAAGVVVGLAAYLP
jgi:hypothetical protein